MTHGSTDWALRTKFLAEMEAVIPWVRLLAVIEPCYPEAPQHPLAIVASDAAHLLCVTVVQAV